MFIKLLSCVLILSSTISQGMHHKCYLEELAVEMQCAVIGYLLTEGNTYCDCKIDHIKQYYAACRVSQKNYFLKQALRNIQALGTTNRYFYGLINTPSNLLFIINQLSRFPGQNELSIVHLLKKMPGVRAPVIRQWYATSKNNSFFEDQLRKAVLYESSNNIKEFLKRMVNCNAANKMGITPLMIAAYNEKNEIIEILTQSLDEACLENNFRFKKNLIDLNKQDKEGNTALMFACKIGNLKTVELLIKKGAQLALANHEGENALTKAVGAGKENIISLLLELGCDPNCATRKDGITPLMMAAQNNDRDTMNLLVQKGAQLEKCDVIGRTVLQRMVHYDSSYDVRVIEWLLKNKAHIDTKDYALRTPLIVAASFNKYYLIPLLLTYKPDLNLQDIHGCTALMKSITLGNSIAKDLIDAGAKVDIKNDDGQSALDLLITHEEKFSKSFTRQQLYNSKKMQKILSEKMTQERALKC